MHFDEQTHPPHGTALCTWMHQVRRARSQIERWDQSAIGRLLCGRGPGGSCAKAAVAGADALLMEVHPKSGGSVSDAAQQVSLKCLPTNAGIAAIDSAAEGMTRSELPSGN